MGRNAGWLTAASALARRGDCTAPHLIYLPEVVFDPEAFLQKLQELGKTVKNIIFPIVSCIKIS